jgi:hypothetical protein
MTATIRPQRLYHLRDRPGNRADCNVPDVAIACPRLDGFPNWMAHPELLQPHELRTQLIQSRDLSESVWEEQFLPKLGSA